MAENHYLGFKQSAGRGLRYGAVWRGQWLALLGWQTGVFQCAPRDTWVGWHPAVQMRRLHLVANNTRFLIRAEGEGVQNLGSYVLGANLRRLSGDWQAQWGHPLLLAETVVKVSAYRGTVYLASNWIAVGLSHGYARSNGQYTNKHGVKKKMLLYPLQADAPELLRDLVDRPEWHCAAVRVQYGRTELDSLRSLLEEVADPRHTRGLRHPLGAVLALLALLKLSGRSGGRAAEIFSKALPQEDWQAGFGRPLQRVPEVLRGALGHDLPAGPGAARAGFAGARDPAMDTAALPAAAGAGGGRQAPPGREPVGAGGARQRDAGGEQAALRA